jgi:hypothetical protein
MKKQFWTEPNRLSPITRQHFITIEQLYDKINSGGAINAAKIERLSFWVKIFAIWLLLFAPLRLIMASRSTQSAFNKND